MDEQIFYHFLPTQDAIDDLENNKIKISTLDSLNDPFEFMPYKRYGFKERQPYNKVFRIISKKWGLLCFSKDWSNPLLWSHYADRHKGIAIGFEITQHEILKVDYDPDPIRKQIKLTDDLTIDETLFLNLAKVKYKKWEYENEYRVLVKLEECSPSTDKGFRFIEFGNKLRVKRIILGCKFDHKKERDGILGLANKLHAEIIPTRMGWEDYCIHQCGTMTKLYQRI